MRRLFPISISFTGNFLELVTDLFPEQTLKSFIVGEFDGTLFFSGALLLSSSHSGDLPC